MREKTIQTIIVIIAVLVIGSLFISMYEKTKCQNGEYVPTGTGAMECYGGEFYKRCEPETTFVCHDKR